jgi:hypothetical protein
MTCYRKALPLRLHITLSSSNSGGYDETVLFRPGNKKCIQDFGYETSVWEPGEHGQCSN